jgi:hypothetical protein
MKRLLPFLRSLEGKLSQIASNVTQSAQTSALARATRRGEEAGLLFGQKLSDFIRAASLSFSRWKIWTQPKSDFLNAFCDSETSQKEEKTQPSAEAGVAAAY